MSIGEVLKQARSAKNLSQEDAAEKVGVSRQTISSWENGRSYPDFASTVALSDTYSVTLDSLLKGDSKMIKHLEESTNVTKSKKQVVASLIAIVLFLFGTAFTIVVLGGYLSDFINLPTLVLLLLPLAAVLTITRSFKLFGIGLRAALFPKKELEDDVRKQAAQLFSLMSKTTMLAAVITTLISLVNLLRGFDYSASNALVNFIGNATASLVFLLYGLLIIVFIFEPVVYILNKEKAG